MVQLDWVTFTLSMDKACVLSEYLRILFSQSGENKSQHFSGQFVLLYSSGDARVVLINPSH